MRYIIIGGTSGIGLATAKQAVDAGHAVIAALEAMVPALASELRPTRVNAVVPGVVDTPWWSRVPDAARAELFENLASEVAVGRIGRPEDLASAIMFVTSNTFVTGAILDCEGGWKLKN